MIDSVMDFATGAMSSPWIYLLILSIAFLDGFFPVVPSETLVISAGVFAAAGKPNLALVILVAALGAIAGDHVSYAIGRKSSGRLMRRQDKAFVWARKVIGERGGLILVVARYIPGGRTATTMTMGAAGYPRRRFTKFDVLAGLSWAVYSALVGYIGGAAFEHDPKKGLLLGLGIAIAVTVTVEAVRYVRKKKAAAPAQPEIAREKVGV